MKYERTNPTRKSSAFLASTMKFLGLLLPLFSAIPLSAQDTARISLFGGGSFFRAEKLFIVDDDAFESTIKKSGRVGVRATSDLDESWAVELGYGFSNQDLNITDFEQDLEVRRFKLAVHQVAGNLLYYFAEPENEIRPFATAGLEINRFTPTQKSKTLASTVKFIDRRSLISSSNTFGFNFGAGAEARFIDWLGFRFDLRDHVLGIPRFGLPDERPGPGGAFYPVSGAVHNIEATVGVFFRIP